MTKRARLSKNTVSRLTALVIAGVASVVVVTGCADGVSDTAQGEYHTIPSSTNRPSDPSPVPASTDRQSITPEEAPLGQLWALADSEVGDDPAPSSSAGPGVGLAEFSEAIATRCYPQLSDSSRTELDQLKAAYQSQTGAAAADSAHSYFVRATELCM